MEPHFLHDEEIEVVGVGNAILGLVFQGGDAFVTVEKRLNSLCSPHFQMSVRS